MGSIPLMDIPPHMRISGTVIFFYYKTTHFLEVTYVAKPHVFPTIQRELKAVCRGCGGQHSRGHQVEDL